MGDLKWITQKEFEMYLRVKEFMEKNGYDESDLRKKVRGKMHTHIPLIICSNDMELTKYECLTDTASDIKVPRETLIYTYENRRLLITRRKGGVMVFYIQWLER